MNQTTTRSSAPALGWRVLTLVGLWFAIFGVIMAVTTVPMEAGYDPTQEKALATLMGPFVGWIGVTTLLGGSEPSPLAGFFSFLAIFGPTGLMLFRCRTRPAFWILMTAHMVVVTAASAAFIHVCKNP